MSSGTLFVAKVSPSSASSTTEGTSIVAGSRTSIPFPKWKLISPPCLEPSRVDMSLILLELFDHIDNVSFKQLVTSHMFIFDSLLEGFGFQLVSDQISTH